VVHRCAVPSDGVPSDAAPSEPSAADGFARTFGRRPDVVWFAPGRLNVVGEFTDYNGGLALPLALPLGVSMAAARRRDGQVWVSSAQVADRPHRLDGDRGIAGWAGFVAGALAVLAVPVSAGVDVHVDGNVPVGAGLSSSAALACSVVAALAELAGVDLSPDGLVDAAWQVEHDYLGVPCGRLDQTAAVHGQAGAAMLFDAEAGTVVQVPLDPERLGAELVIVPLRGRHRLADGAYAARRHGCEDAARRLGVPSLRHVRPDQLPEVARQLDAEAAGLVRHVVTENDRVVHAAEALAADGGAADLGELLSRSHASLRDDFGVTTTEADDVVAALVTGGAFGARMVGGGFGGSVVAVVPSGDLRPEGVVPPGGLVPPGGFVARASTGAHRQ